MHCVVLNTYLYLNGMKYGIQKDEKHPCNSLFFTVCSSSLKIWKCMSGFLSEWVCFFLFFTKMETKRNEAEFSFLHPLSNTGEWDHFFQDNTIQQCTAIVMAFFTLMSLPKSRLYFWINEIMKPSPPLSSNNFQ